MPTSKLKIAFGGAAVLGAGLLGISAAFAQPAHKVTTITRAVASNPVSAAPVAAAPVAAAPVAAAPVAAAPVAAATASAPAVSAAEPAGPDTDTLQEGDQTTPDVPGATADETAGNESETGSANDDPNGHADPPGDVQHEGGAGEN